MQDSRPALRLSFLWVAASTASFAIGFWFLDGIVNRVGAFGTLLIGGAVFGALTGAFQSLVLRLALKVKAAWIALMTLAGMIGLAIGGPTWLLAAYRAGFVPGLMAAGAVVGAFTGVAGFVAFRRTLESPWLWLLANVAAVAAGLGLGGSVLVWFRPDLSTQGAWLLIGAVGGFVYGTVTGTFLARHQL